MRVSDIEERLAHIDAIKDDDEAAHAEQDALYELVLKDIADGGSDAAEKARTVLTVTAIPFARWMA